MYDSVQEFGQQLIDNCKAALKENPMYQGVCGCSWHQELADRLTIEHVSSMVMTSMLKTTNESARLPLEDRQSPCPSCFDERNFVVYAERRDKRNDHPSDEELVSALVGRSCALVGS
jgi:hypothetical protein